MNNVSKSNPLDALLAQVASMSDEEINNEVETPEPVPEPEVTEEEWDIEELIASLPEEPEPEPIKLFEEPVPEQETVSIASAAMLVEFSTKQWSESKNDKVLAEQIAVAKGIDPKYVRAGKKLLGDCPELKAIGKFIADVRNNVHYKLTLPFYDSGVRLLPTTLYPEYVQEMSAAESKFQPLVDAFITVYEQKRQSVRYEMGDLYDENLYPPADVVRSKFAFSYNFAPVPEAGDFRVDIAEEQKRQLTEQYKGFYSSQVERATSHLFNEIAETLQVLSTQLDFSKEDKKKKIFNSRIEGVQRMIRMLETCNVNGDPTMEKVAKQLRRNFDNLSAESLRVNETLRAETKRGVDETLKAMQLL